MKKNQTKKSGNSYWSNLISHGDELPKLTTDSLVMGFSANATVTGTIIHGGSSEILSYGFVYADHDDPTIDDNSVEVGTEPFLGQFTDGISSLDSFTDVTLYFAAYATNKHGTGYGTSLTGVPQICFAEGTLITTANRGKKKIEDITYDDDLLVWNFDEAKFDTAKPVWILQPFKSYAYGSIQFKDGNELKTVADGRGHRVFNSDRNLFTYSMDNDDTPVGTSSFTEQGKTTNIIKKDIVKAETMFYNVITNRHINVFANNILTSSGLNNLYPIKEMKFSKCERKSRTLADFDSSVTREIFEGFRLAEQPLSYTGLESKIKNIVNRQFKK